MQQLHDSKHQTTTIGGSSIAVGIASAWLGAITTGVVIFILGRASETFEQHLALVLAAMSVTVLGIWFAPGTRGVARFGAIGGIAVALLFALALGGALSQATTVDEQVITADAVAPDAMMAKDPSGDAMMAKDPSGDAMMAKDPSGDAMVAKEPSGDAMMAKEPTGDAMMAKEPSGDAMAATDAAPARNLLLSSGEFEPLEHAGQGTASLIRTTDGRTVLTLTNFSTDAGPDLDVRLVAGNPMTDADVEAGRSIRLAKLKGTSGDQQYVLPANVDPSEFTDVYIWCRAFSVGFTRAHLA